MNHVQKTWLPVFSGFYGTIWEVSDTDFLEYNLKEDGLTTEEINQVYSLNCYNEACVDYMQSVCKNAVGYIANELKNFVTDITYEQLVSPKEYNFSNDSIYVSIKLSPDNVKTIAQYLVTHSEKWVDYLFKNYTSCSGFWSSHDNYHDAPEWQIDNIIKDEHCLGAVLNFICENEDITEESMYSYKDCCDIFLSGETVKKELTEKGFYNK